MLTNEHARAWLKTVVAAHLPKTGHAVNYKYRTYVMSPQGNAIGLMADLHPQEGKVVEVSDDWCLLKLDRVSFFVADRRLLDSTPDLGAVVRITPYARRGFDGLRADTPAKQEIDGVVIRTFTVGRVTTRLPIVNREGLRCQELIDTINLIEDQLTPDGCRSLSQALVDAGAAGHPIGYKDPLPIEILHLRPSLQFRVSTAKFQGHLNIVYDRAGDHYVVQLAEFNTAEIVKQEDGVLAPDLAAAVVRLIDDQAWRIAKVEVLKAAPKRRAPKNDVIPA